MSESPPVELSVVLAIYNEAENIRPLIAELDEVLSPLGRPFEIVCVDDCSTDASVAIIREVQVENPSVRLVRHRINCGQSAATASGFHVARGDIVITLDADQQNDPHDLPAMLDALTDKVAAVVGVRRQRRDTWAKRRASKIANGFRNWITGEPVTDAGCAVRVMRRAALREILVFNGMHRFIPTMLRLQGYRVVETSVNHRPRTRGESKYGINDRLWRGIRDCFAMRWYRARVFPADRAESPE